MTKMAGSERTPRGRRRAPCTGTSWIPRPTEDRRGRCRAAKLLAPLRARPRAGRCLPPATARARPSPEVRKTRKTTTVKLWTPEPRCHRGYSSPAAVRPSISPSPTSGSYDRSILDRNTPRGDVCRLSTWANTDFSGTLFVLDGLDDALAGGGAGREEAGEDTYEEA
jgi:hypothetical protein